ncbi:hypothetical protein CHELA1G11_11385 [Hyphomicrobiales bacterium]|nr:hypothetical protein CHELA1G11_11385 [Hyphomicrobiales bacterium]CAH1668133.1 hypothetical protein CHELA1G2_12924 [Hyphomicrobiales bacterium]
MRYAVLFRTHYWTDYLEERYTELKQQMKSGDLFITYDATNSAPPDRPDVVPHSLDSLRHIGLYVPATKALWYCGDYPFYDFFIKKPDYDYYLMIENDVLIKGVDLDAVMAKLHEEQVDVLGAHFAKYSPDAKFQTARVGRSLYKTWQKCFFPTVGLSRAALVSLYASRLKQAEAKARSKDAELPFCESFLGSEAADSGMKYVEMKTVLPVKRYGAGKYFLKDMIDKDIDVGVWHPVLPTDKYLDAVIKHECGVRGADAFIEGSHVWNHLDVLLQSNFMERGEVQKKVHELASRSKHYEHFRSRLAALDSLLAAA